MHFYLIYKTLENQIHRIKILIPIIGIFENYNFSSNNIEQYIIQIT